MKTVYKLTDANDRTYGGCQWGSGVEHRTNGEGELCGPGWIHVYTHPLLAVLLNQIHGGFVDYHLWECSASGESKNDHGLKWGYTIVQTIRRVEPPTVTPEQAVRFAIYCARAVYTEPTWDRWADGWLSGADRSDASAQAASAQAARSSSDAKVSRAEVAAMCVAIAAGFPRHARSHGMAARAVEHAASTTDLGLIALARRAMAEEKNMKTTK